MEFKVREDLIFAGDACAILQDWSGKHGNVE